MAKASILNSQSVQHGVPQEIVLVTILVYIELIVFGLLNELSTSFVNHLLLLQYLFSVTLTFKIEHGIPHNWERCESNIVHLVDDFLIKRLP